jgi:hypothetical protein
MRAIDRAIRICEHDFGGTKMIQPPETAPFWNIISANNKALDNGRFSFSPFAQRYLHSNQYRV